MLQLVTTNESKWPRGKIQQHQFYWPATFAANDIFSHEREYAMRYV